VIAPDSSQQRHHGELMVRFESRERSPEVVDLLWCNLVGHLLDGCNPDACKGLPEGSNNCLGRTTCAYSYITPVHHLDDREVEKRNLSTISTAKAWMWTHVEQRRYLTMPSFSPKGSYLRNEPCWNASALADALINWTAPARQAQPVIPPPKKWQPPAATLNPSTTRPSTGTGRGARPRKPAMVSSRRKSSEGARSSSKGSERKGKGNVVQESTLAFPDSPD
jgi:hypothetical protein